MRNYWLRIFLGAFAIFAIGMVGVSIVRKGLAKVNKVVDSTDPLTIPLAFVPFVLSGERLGNLEHVVVNRSSPREVNGVELEIDLADSLLAAGLSGCKLAANFESDSTEPGINIKESRGKDTFSCFPSDSTPANMVAFGEAVFQPGEVRVPLYVPLELVTELNQALAQDSMPHELSSEAESLTDLAELKSDSALDNAVRSADSVGRAGRRLGDSLRAAALRHADSARAELRRMADSS
jgi:hypothetical protein